jgi:AcrR family transcriptional regulator
MPASRVTPGTSSPATPSPGTPQRTPDGRHARWDSHREARRRELIDAAIIAVRDYGEAVGMDQIAAVAHTSKAVIYRYFADKADLYRAIGQRMAGRLLGLMTTSVGRESDPRLRARAVIDAYLGVLDETPELYQFVARTTLTNRRGADGALIEDFVSMVDKLVTDSLRADLAERGMNPDLASPWASAMLGFVRSAGDWWLANRAMMTREQLADYLTALLWDGAAVFYSSAGVSGEPTSARAVFGALPG